MKIVFVKDYPPFKAGDKSNVSFTIANSLIKEEIVKEDKEEIKAEKPKKEAKK